MEDQKFNICVLLDDLSEKELNRFKRFLTAKLLDRYDGIQWGNLEKKDVTETVWLMEHHYGTTDLLNITRHILEKIARRDLIEKLQIPKGASEATVGEDSHSENSVAPTTKPVSQKWIQHSTRWKSQLQKLMESNTVKRVGSLIFLEEYLIAQGSQGTGIYLGLREGVEVAIKRVVRANFVIIQEEMKILQDPNLESPYLVRCVDSAKDEDFFYIALQLCEYSLDEYLEENKPAGGQLKQIAQDVLLGLQVLHKAGVIHRDIKPHNVLIDVSGQARLADFGLSRKLNTTQTHKSTDRAGTQYWEAAEILQAHRKKKGPSKDQSMQYRKSTDIQVAGMLVYYILTMGEHHPFGEHPHDPMCVANILNGTPSLDEITDEEAKDLIGLMICKDPEQRPRVEECLQHTYFCGKRRPVHPLENNELQPNTSKIPERIVQVPERVYQENVATSVHGEDKQVWTIQSGQEVEVYAMTTVPRGCCVIINIYKFTNNTMTQRNGSEKDEVALKEVFTWLGFEVHIFTNLTAQHMRDTLETFRTREHNDCFVCCILSHGSAGIVYGTDSEAMEVSDLLDLFRTVKCPGLAGKPKVFFIQACQKDDAISKSISIPDSDFLCCMATIQGENAYRNKMTGTFFMQSICHQLREHCPRGEDVVRILTRVKREVSSTGMVQMHQKTQIPEQRDTLTKMLVFHVPEGHPD
ncbi:uncharacterized protein LOC143121611 isoform X3 [Alosa pseudoharengus]|uniref:uncharacterized protein LOC143121611 isoform X3 n=1 Tax=Alosa pseudoharengus TaxID=34774 RepID=UPI003F8CE52A